MSADETAVGSAHRFIVDRREGAMVVITDEAHAGVSIDVPHTALPAQCAVEGAVLEVPIGPDGVPRWSAAVRNRAEEARRVADARQRLDRLTQHDDGGNLKL